MALTPPEATTIAESIVVALCGSRWTVPPVSMIDEYPLPQSGRVVLSGRPVREIASVAVDGEVLDPAKYYLRNGCYLFLDKYYVSCYSGGQLRKVEIEYTYGLDAYPEPLQRAIEEMTEQIMLADGDSADCKIPERVTSVSRQGVSWTLIDPQDFLQDGRTGIYAVDIAIKALNPKNSRRRARIFTTDIAAPPIRRIPT
jgi:hypothetical protein